MKQLGTILIIVGIVGMIFFGYEYYQDTSSISVLGVDVAASTGNYVPILISGLVVLVGIVAHKYLE